MTILLIVLALAVVAGVAAFATGAGGRMGAAPPDLEPVDLPDDRWVQGRDLDRTRFALGLRGYRMDQVDAVLDRLSADLVQRDDYVEVLTTALTAAGIEVPPAPEPAVPAEPSADAEAMDDEPLVGDGVDGEQVADATDAAPDVEASDAPDPEQGSDADIVGDRRA